MTRPRTGRLRACAVAGRTGSRLHPGPWRTGRDRGWRGECLQREPPDLSGSDGVRPLFDAGHGSRVVEDQLDEIDVAVGPTIERHEVAPGLDEDHPAIARWGDDVVDEGDVAVGEERAPQQSAHRLASG